MRLGICSLLLLVPLPLGGCGLTDLLAGGSDVHDAIEYLPADTIDLTFAARAAMAERLGLDGLDPRDLSEADVEEYADVLAQKEEEAVASTLLDSYLPIMKEAPLNAIDVVWETSARWGEDPSDPEGVATLWKVGDDLDFDDLADDLEATGYDRGGSEDRPIYSIDEAQSDDIGTFGGTYPASMINVLLDEDEQIVASASSADSLDDVADVIAEDADSLADDGGMDALLDASHADAELAWLRIGAAVQCITRRIGADEAGLVEAYADVRRPEGSALFVSGEPAAVLVLQHEDAESAADDQEARETLLDDGVDLQVGERFSEVGEFDIDRNGALLLIESDWDDGVHAAFRAEAIGGGPGACFEPEA